MLVLIFETWLYEYTRYETKKTGLTSILWWQSVMGILGWHNSRWNRKWVSGLYKTNPKTALSLLYTHPHRKEARVRSCQMTQELEFVSCLVKTWIQIALLSHDFDTIARFDHVCHKRSWALSLNEHTSQGNNGIGTHSPNTYIYVQASSPWRLTKIQVLRHHCIEWNWELTGRHLTPRTKMVGLEGINWI